MSSRTKPVWDLDSPSLAGAPLGGDVKYDVCVVGGGIAGLTTAYLLAFEGKSVVVLEAQPRLAGAETGHTTAHLSWVIDDRFARLAAVRCDGVARAAADSHRDAIDSIGRITSEEGIDCDFRRVEGYLFAGADGPDAVNKEAEELRRLGIPFEPLDRPPLSGLGGPCLKFEGQGQFHPKKYLSGVAAAVRRHGGVIHTDTRAVRIEGGSPCNVRTRGGHTITASSVVVATNSPFDAGTLLHTRMAAYTTYAVAVEVPRGAVPVALYWDTEDPYHYVRTQPGESGTDYLVVGGEDHKTGQADDQDDRWARLEEWTRQRVPQAGGLTHRWSGQVFETPDGLGLLGAAPWGRNVFVITGDSGMGMTHCTLGAKLVANLIRGEDDPLAKVYDPSRWMPAALKTFLSENLNVAAQYADWLSGGDVKSVEDIPPGQGAIVRRGLKRLAVYRRKDGTTCEMSASCRHMGAAVRWNPGEQTWDCPAHGSRYSCDGKVIHGPAVEGLKSAGECGEEEPLPVGEEVG
jgi:glycine/D-amino acid oxidase-like deaminating enzyme/nitrite reductase/ring-hydroxylating ferredoxin subunit